MPAATIVACHCILSGFTAVSGKAVGLRINGKLHTFDLKDKLMSKCRTLYSTHDARREREQTDAMQAAGISDSFRFTKDQVRRSWCIQGLLQQKLSHCQAHAAKQNAWPALTHCLYIQAGNCMLCMCLMKFGCKRGCLQWPS